MIEPADVELWNADMDAWRLTPQQRTHHLRRLHGYHSALMDRHIARYERASRAEAAFAVAALAAVIVLIVLAVAS